MGLQKPRAELVLCVTSRETLREISCLVVKIASLDMRVIRIDVETILHWRLLELQNGISSAVGKRIVAVVGKRGEMMKPDQAYFGMPFHYFNGSFNEPLGRFEHEIVLMVKNVLALCSTEASIGVCPEPGVAMRRDEPVNWKCSYVMHDFFVTSIIRYDELNIIVRAVAAELLDTKRQQVQAVK